MKKICFILGLLVAGAVVFTSCEEKLGPSIFCTEPIERNNFDQWLFDNFVLPYNVEILYKFVDIESSLNHNLIPASLENSKKMAQIIKHVWFDAYAEVVNEEFLRRNSPRTLQFIGSSAWVTETMRILGTAEGGLKVTLYMINELSLDMETLNTFYFGTMHHEFAHILHQNRMYDLAFREITPVYIGDEWRFTTLSTALRGGWITPYAASAADEDFVELFTRYIITTPSTWESWMNIAQTGIIRPRVGDTPAFTGRDAIEQKLEIIRLYMINTWGLCIELMRDVSLRRAGEVATMEFDMFED